MNRFLCRRNAGSDYLDLSFLLTNLLMQFNWCHFAFVFKRNHSNHAKASCRLAKASCRQAKASCRQAKASCRQAKASFRQTKTFLDERRHLSTSRNVNMTLMLRVLQRWNIFHVSIISSCLYGFNTSLYIC